MLALGAVGARLDQADSQRQAVGQHVQEAADRPAQDEQPQEDHEFVEESQHGTDDLGWRMASFKRWTGIMIAAVFDGDPPDLKPGISSS
jgi:hypothetical protein